MPGIRPQLGRDVPCAHPSRTGGHAAQPLRPPQSSTVAEPTRHPVLLRRGWSNGDADRYVPGAIGDGPGDAVRHDSSQLLRDPGRRIHAECRLSVSGPATPAESDGGLPIDDHRVGCESRGREERLYAPPRAFFLRYWTPYSVAALP